MIVVGAGAGGLAAAADLASAGFDVTVLERAAAPGGKMRSLQAGGFDIDAGPTVFTMRWVFEGLFEAAGVGLDDALQLSAAEVLARHAWTSGGRLDLYADPDASVRAISEFAGPAEGQAYRRFLDKCADVYRTLETPFIRSERPRSTRDLMGRVGLRGLPGLVRTQPMQSLWRALGASFRDPRLRQLFARYATYVGASPLSAPATLVLIAHVEQAGVWLVRGGMCELARQMQLLGERCGATFRFGAQVREILIEGDRVRGVLLEGDERVLADAVVFNGDSAALGSGLLGQSATRAAPPTPRSQRSLSAVTWCAAARPEGFPLQHHNVFFAEDYPREFKRVFEDRSITDAPTRVSVRARAQCGSRRGQRRCRRCRGADAAARERPRGWRPAVAGAGNANGAGSAGTGVEGYAGLRPHARRFLVERRRVHHAGRLCGVVSGDGGRPVRPGQSRPLCPSSSGRRRSLPCLASILREDRHTPGPVCPWRHSPVASRLRA